MIDFNTAWRAAEDFVRRHSKSKAVREAEKRRQERRQQQAWRKTKQGAAVAGVSGAAIFGYAITVTPLAMAAVAAGGAAVAGVALAQLWASTRTKRASLSREELAALPVQAEEWLLDQRQFLPRGAEPSFDAILTHLGDLPRHLVRLEPNSTLAWEARRLIGEHLPTLVAAWCGLPAVTRDKDVETRERLVAGLATIAGELERLCEEASRDERMTLETRGRYLDSRYRDGSLSGS